ncbi:MAG: glycosyltransferase [Gemmatimonadaceae bacterium]
MADAVASAAANAVANPVADHRAPVPRIAIVHEWLVTVGGSEAVLQELIRLLPTADLFCLLDRLPQGERTRLGVGYPRTSWLQRLPAVHRYYRALLPFMPHAIERLDLSAYDLVISNSHAVAKGVRPREGAVHLCHCCSPVRYAWDLRERYLEEAGIHRGPLGWLARGLLERLRRWDLTATDRVTAFVAISAFIADRIARAYDRPSTVVYPPVDTEYFTIDQSVPRGTHYFTASRLVGYKQIPAIAEAFAELPDRHLVVIGDGPDRKRLLSVAGPNVTWLGHQSRERVRHEMRRARAFLFAAEEDFGIVPVEAQACGTPVIALGKGGSLETVIGEGAARTGHFFAEATPQAIAEAIRHFEAAPAPNAEDCRRQATRFATSAFHAGMRAAICAVMPEAEAALAPTPLPEG